MTGITLRSDKDLYIGAKERAVLEATRYFLLPNVARAAQRETRLLLAPHVEADTDQNKNHPANPSMISNRTRCGSEERSQDKSSYFLH